VGRPGTGPERMARPGVDRTGRVMEGEVTMESSEHASAKKRIVVAPQTEPVGAQPGAPAVISVEVAEDEEVEWQWTHDTDGHSVVTGYTIVKKADETREAGAGVLGQHANEAVG
jgi:hypothetical protein